MNTLIAVGILLAGATPYDRVHAQAKPVPSLGRWLKDYLGECPSAVRGGPEHAADRAACVAQARRFRRAWGRKALRVTIDEPTDVLAMVGFDRRKKAFRLNLVPFFSVRGLGLSVGRPRRVTADGRPVMRHWPLWVKLPEDTPPFVFRRNLERGMVQLELIVVPTAPYRLRRSKRTPIRGLEVKLRGLRLIRARSGDVLLERVYQR